MKLKLILVCLMVLGATPSILFTADSQETTSLGGLIKSIDRMQERKRAKVKLQIQMANEIRRQWADTGAEVRF